MNKKILPPAQIWEGNKQELQEEARLFLQRQFCSSQTSQNSQSCSCIECRKIKILQHHDILWISPEKNYYVEDIEQIFEKIVFVLAENQNFFFVLENAHTLTSSTANRLLKVLEEPPLGYKFILLTNNIQAILPTIRSRCFIKQIYKIKDLESHPLLSFFHDQNKLLEPVTFAQELKSHGLTENESTEMLNDLLHHFSKRLIELYKAPTFKEKELKHYEKVVSFIKNQITLPPQAGSSTLFWKNLYLNFPRK